MVSLTDEKAKKNFKIWQEALLILILKEKFSDFKVTGILAV